MSYPPALFALIGLLATASMTPARAADGEEPYENEVVIVVGDKLSREMTLQVIKSGLTTSRSEHPDQADRVVCRIETVTGSRCKHLWCSTNGELKQIRDRNLKRFSGFGDALKHGGMVEVHSGPDPANPCTTLAGLKRELAELPAPETRFVTLSERSMRRFADVYPRVHAIQTGYDARILRVSNPARAGELQDRADSEMAEVIEAAGLEIDEYNRIASYVRRDASLRARVEDLLGE